MSWGRKKPWWTMCRLRKAKEVGRWWGEWATHQYESEMRCSPAPSGITPTEACSSSWVLVRSLSVLFLQCILTLTYLSSTQHFLESVLSDVLFLAIKSTRHKILLQQWYSLLLPSKKQPTTFLTICYKGKLYLSLQWGRT